YSTMVWWNEGLITRASVIRFNKIRTDYTYEYENGRLVHRIKEDLKNGKSETRYSYADGRLIKIIYQDQASDEETNFQYSDSLITTTSITNARSSVWRSNTATRLDKEGRKISLRIYMQRPKDP